LRIAGFAVSASRTRSPITRHSHELAMSASVTVNLSARVRAHRNTAYGSAPNLDWLVKEKAIAPHVPVIDKLKREDRTFSREDFIYDKARDIYTCPCDKPLQPVDLLQPGAK
jgi:hypothetical protein